MNALAVLDVAQARVVRTIDLTPWQGLGMAPYAESLARVGDEVWLTLQRHDDPFQRRSTQPGVVLRIDPLRERVVGTIVLRHANPVGPLVASPDARTRALVTLGSYDRTDDGAIEVIDVTTGRLAAPIVTEAELGANIDAFVWLDADRVVLRLSDARAEGGDLRGVRTVLWNLSTRRVTPLVEMSRWGAAAPVVAASRLYVADPGTGTFWQGAGLHVFSRDALVGAGRLIPFAPGYGPYDVQPAL
jgi:hypothetical protein